MRSLIGVVLRRSWLILAVAVLVGIGLFTIAKRRPLTYTATAQLEVLNMNSMRQAIGIPGSVPSEVLLVEIPPQIHQLATARRAAVLLGARSHLTPLKLLAQSSAAVDVNSGLIGVSATAHDPDIAAAIANDLAQGYLEREQRQLGDRMAAAQSRLQRTLNTRVKTLRRRVHGAPGSHNPATARVNAAVAVSGVRSATNRIEQLRLTSALYPRPIVFDHPAGPGSFSGISPNIVGMIGIALGLVVGIIILLAHQLLSPRINSLGKLERATGLPVLVRIPRSRRIAKLVPLERLRSREVVAFRALLSELWHRPDPRGVRRVAVASPGPDPVAYATAYYLAASAALSGARTQFVSTSAHSERVAEMAAEISSLTLATAHGSDPADAVVTHAEPACDGAGEYDFVVIETPPTVMLVDASLHVSDLDGVVIVCRNGKVSAEQVRSLRLKLRALRTRPLGVAAFGFPGQYA